VAWDLRADGSKDLVKPGTYRVTLQKQSQGATTQLGGVQVFEVVPLPPPTKGPMGPGKKGDDKKKKLQVSSH
jgi:hypothetical protein